MIVTIHQPEHMPWAGFFHKMSLADKYVVLDNVQFKKNNWQNRNRINSKKGDAQWLTVPVMLKGHTGSTIRDIKINEQDDWRRKYWGRIYDSYCKYPYFSLYAGELKDILNKHHSHISELNCDLIGFFRAVLGINNEVIFASDLSVRGNSSELLVSIVNAVGGTFYLSGPDGSQYMDLDLFSKNNIEVMFHQFTPPTYTSDNGFISGLSILDLIMSHGEASALIIGINRK